MNLRVRERVGITDAVISSVSEIYLNLPCYFAAGYYSSIGMPLAPSYVYKVTRNNSANIQANNAINTVDSERLLLANLLGYTA